MTTAMLPRTYLFVPGHKPERFAKALASGADAIIIDLEDAVPADGKPAARDAVADWLKSGAAAKTIIRINAEGTEFFDDDLKVLALPGVEGVMLPKAESAAGIERLRSRLWRRQDLAVLPLIESAQGFANLQEIAQAKGVQRLVFGTVDFQLDLGMHCGDEELSHFRPPFVMASRLAGIGSPVDGVCTTLDDPACLKADAARGRRFGFGAKLCIHPKQVDVVAACFAPSDDEVTWALRVLAADRESGGAAVKLDGQMIDKPVVLRAKALLARA